MPLPEAKPDEEENEFVDRCMKDETLNKDFPDPSQRLAICYSAWRRKHPDDETKETESAGKQMWISAEVDFDFMEGNK